MPGNARVIVWFRTDLRLHDNPALKAALDLEPDVLWPIFTWDPHYVYRARGGLNRWQYLLDCQNDLSASITKLNPKSRLFVLREAPQTVFPKLFQAWKVTHLVFEKDTDSYARSRDEVVAQAARDAGVEVVVKYGRTLWDSDEVVEKNGGKPTMSITQLQNAGAKIGAVPKPLLAPTCLPDPGEMPLDEIDGDSHRNVPEGDPDVNAKWRTEGEEKAYAHSVAGPDGDFAIETLAELGYQAASTQHRGGETGALQRLEKVVSDLSYAAIFRKPRTSPANIVEQDGPSTTLLSPDLHFGSLSVRLFYWRAVEATEKYVAECKKKGTKSDAAGPPESLTGQLLFRDMYFAAQAAIGTKFLQTVGNKHCRFVPWHLPSKVGSDGLITFDYEVDNEKAEEWFKRWEHGRTGFPWIDALMRQLRKEGWIHHIHWERGAAVFEELLLDHEPACNAGNWQWLSCTAFFAQYFRMYSPVSFPQKWDKKGAFVRRWVPELQKLDAKYIYEPWKAPIADQKAAGVRIQGDGSDKEEGDGEEHGTNMYPKPMFDFAERRKFCLGAMKKAYDVGLHGSDAQVLDGSWRDLFDGDGGDTVMGDEGGGVDTSDDGADADANEDADGEVERVPRRRRRSDAGGGGGWAKGPPAKCSAKQGTLDRHVKKQRTA